MTATLPEPPQLYSFDCPACRSTLSIPVSMEGVTGPCPHCQTTLTAPSLLQSPEYAAYYHAHQQAYLEQQQQAYEFSQQQWAPEIEPEPEPDFATLWSQPQAAPQAVAPQYFQEPAPAPAISSWQEMVGEAAPAVETQHAEPKQPRVLAPSAPGRSPLLKFGLAAGVLGLIAGVYATLKPKPVPVVEPYQPSVRVPLTPEQEATFNASATKTTAPEIPSHPAAAVPEPSPALNPASASTQPPAPESLQPPPSPAPSPEADPIENAPKALPPDSNSERPPTAKVVSENDTPPEPIATPSEVDNPKLLDEPRLALTEFLAAPNWKERARYTQHSAEFLKEMKEYYADHADGPIKADSPDYLTSQSTPDGKSRFHLFNVDCGDGFSFPVSVESVDGGFKVDWKAFVEFKDLQLPKYFQKYSSQPGTFHVVMHRTHYFGSDVPNQEKKLCFIVEPPVPGFVNYAWVDKSDTALISKLASRADFGYTSYPVVSLRWVKEKDGSAYVMLYEIVADSWRTDATLPKPTSAQATP